MVTCQGFCKICQIFSRCSSHCLQGLSTPFLKNNNPRFLKHHQIPFYIVFFLPASRMAIKSQRYITQMEEFRPDQEVQWHSGGTKCFSSIPAILHMLQDQVFLQSSADTVRLTHTFVPSDSLLYVPCYGFKINELSQTQSQNFCFCIPPDQGVLFKLQTCNVYMIQLSFEGTNIPSSARPLCPYDSNNVSKST